MKRNEAIQSVSFILCGALLQLFNGIGSGWASTLVAILGFILFYSGLSKLKTGLDANGQGAVRLLSIAAIIGAIASFVDLIPLMWVFAGILYIGAFALELVGFLRLRGSESIGETGKSGAMLLLVAMPLAIIQALIGLIPFVGGFFASFFAVGALVLVLMGWLRVQEGVMGNVLAE